MIPLLVGGAIEQFPKGLKLHFESMRSSNTSATDRLGFPLMIFNL